jgi:hypothetical protein
MMIISGLNTFTLSHCGWQTSATRLYVVCYRPHVLAFVPNWWLAFIRTGLSSLLISAYLGALIVFSPCFEFSTLLHIKSTALLRENIIT